MKKGIITTIISVLWPAIALADAVTLTIPVEDFTAERHGNLMTVNSTLDLSKVKVKSNEALLITPYFINENDTLRLPSVGIYGRKRYYHYLRNTGGEMLSGKDEITLMAKECPPEIEYTKVFPFEEWMEGATLVYNFTEYGCCRHILAQEKEEAGNYYGAFFPELVFQQPKDVAVEKRYTLEGSAFIDFPVDQTIIYPDYRRNTIELDSIRATIDVVKNDPDATIETVWLKGFASPESPYAHNTDLAKGRTEALKQYINNLYHFPDATILTDYEPEDWEGLKKFVENSNLRNREGILDLILSDMEPDAKEAKIKKIYPEDYKFMLQNFYPALRHTDYRVTYVIRAFFDPQEILKVMKTSPQKLSPNEFYAASTILEPGSDEFMELFETMVRMYPDDELSNLNAANAAIRRDDFRRAEQFLAKAGNSGEALYARAALCIRQQNYDEARKLLEEAEKAGFAQARVTLDEMNKRYK